MQKLKAESNKDFPFISPKQIEQAIENFFTNKKYDEFMDEYLMYNVYEVVQYINIDLEKVKTSLDNTTSGAYNDIYKYFANSTITVTKSSKYKSKPLDDAISKVSELSSQIHT